MTSGVKRKPKEIEGLKKSLVEYLLRTPGGTFSGACVAVKLPLCTAYLWRKEDPAFEKAVVAARGIADDLGGDLAESKLMQAINNGELTGIIFYLKTKHKRRGYVEKVEQDVTHRKPIHEMTDEELDAEIADYERVAGPLLPNPEG